MHSETTTNVYVSKHVKEVLHTIALHKHTDIQGATVLLYATRWARPERGICNRSLKESDRVMLKLPPYEIRYWNIAWRGVEHPARGVYPASYNAIANVCGYLRIIPASMTTSKTALIEALARNQLAIQEGGDHYGLGTILIEANKNQSD